MNSIIFRPVSTNYLLCYGIQYETSILNQFKGRIFGLTTAWFVIDFRGWGGRPIFTVALLINVVDILLFGNTLKQ